MLLLSVLLGYRSYVSCVFFVSVVFSLPYVYFFCFHPLLVNTMYYSSPSCTPASLVLCLIYAVYLFCQKKRKKKIYCCSSVIIGHPYPILEKDVKNLKKKSAHI